MGPVHLFLSDIPVFAMGLPGGRRVRTWQEGTHRENPSCKLFPSFFMLTPPVISPCQLCSSFLVLGNPGLAPLGQGPLWASPSTWECLAKETPRGGSKICPFPGLLPGAPRINSAPAPRTSGRLGGHPNEDYRINSFSTHLPSPPTPACLPHPEPHAWSQTSQEVAAALEKEGR